MKKLRILILVVVLTFTFSACLGTSGEKKGVDLAEDPFIPDEEFEKLDLDDAAIGNVLQALDKDGSTSFKYTGKPTEEKFQALASMRVKDGEITDSYFDVENEKQEKLSEKGTAEEKEVLTYCNKYLKEHKNLDELDTKLMEKSPVIAQEFEKAANKLYMAADFI